MYKKKPTFFFKEYFICRTFPKESRFLTEMNIWNISFCEWLRAENKDYMFLMWQTETTGPRSSLVVVYRWNKSSMPACYLQQTYFSTLISPLGRRSHLFSGTAASLCWIFPSETEKHVCDIKCICLFDTSSLLHSMSPWLPLLQMCIY